MQQCRSCGGTYEPIQADGSLYFHACPPLSGAELKAAVDAGKVTLPIDPVTNAPETVDVAVSRRVYERFNKRDENIVGGKARSDGDGVKTVSSGPAKVVIVGGK